jgi:hypothetical protein
MHHAGAACIGAERAGVRTARGGPWHAASVCRLLERDAGTSALAQGQGGEVPSPQFETVQLWQCRGCRRVFTPALAEMASKNTKFSSEIPILSAVPHEMAAVDNQIRHPVMPRPCNSDCAAYGVHDSDPPAVHVYERRGAASS